ncbi:MAG: MFS transporter [Pseudomonadota bacterium]
MSFFEKIKNYQSLTPTNTTAARIAFALLGVMVSMWAALIPYVKQSLQVSESTIGMLLLSLGIGAVVAMPITGNLAVRFGCRCLLLLAFPFSFALLLALPSLSSLWLFAVALFVFGLMIGLIDVAINIQAVLIESFHTRSMMSNFHGMYSLGGILGAAIMAGLLSVDLSPTVTVLILGLVSTCLALFYAKYFLPYGKDPRAQGATTSPTDRATVTTSTQPSQKTRRFTMPKGSVLFLGILCFFLYMNEGTVLGWSGLFLTTDKGVPTSQAGLAYAVFCVTMTIGRLLGDRLAMAYGSYTLLITGAIIIFAGYIMAVASPLALWAYVGFALVGLGSSNMVPQLFSMASKQKDMPVNVAVAVVTTVGYSGHLLGPAIMGFVAHSFGLQFVFELVALFMVLILAVLCRMRYMKM